MPVAIQYINTNGNENISMIKTGNVNNTLISLFVIGLLYLLCNYNL